MAYQVLARKYRPQRFADVAGQQHVTITLMNALTQGRIAHGYIFSGHRGIGKTTIARILAMALNCRNLIGSNLRPSAEPCEICESCTEIRAGNAVDVIEIDAATNRGIDEIRELRDAARYRPARDKYKIYILDEAHQITDAAFNALLKTLEEPPDHIVFMMATTQPEDIPQTVRSRCQHFNFHAVKMADILGELRAIAEHEGVDADEGALSLLAEAGDGSMRDALSVMDQAIASAPLVEGRAALDASQIRELMGTVPNAVFERILGAVNGNRSAEVISVANELLDAGNSPAQLARQFVRFIRNCLVAKISGVGQDGTTSDGHTVDLLQISLDEQRRAGRAASLFTEEELTRFLQMMLRTFDELGYRQEQRFHFELGLLKLVHLRRLLPLEEVLSQLPGVAARSSSGKVVAPKIAMTSVSLREPNSESQQEKAKTSSDNADIRKPAFSPFEADRDRKRFQKIEPSQAGGAQSPELADLSVTLAAERQGTPTKEPGPRTLAIVAEMQPPSTVPNAGSVQESEAPTGVPPNRVMDISLAQPARPLAETATRDCQQTIEQLQRSAVDALLSVKSQGSAADALDEAVWNLIDGVIQVQTTLSKTMLPMVINPEAEKIVRNTIRIDGGTEWKLSLLPGSAQPRVGGNQKTRAGREGSVQAKAEKHPVVQQAQRLFGAEIRNVIDLSEGK